jgi:hypothetical protein
MTLRGLLFAMLAMLIAALFFFLLPIVGLILAGVLVFATPVLLFLGQVRPTGGILIEKAQVSTPRSSGASSFSATASPPKMRP